MKTAIKEYKRQNRCRLKKITSLVCVFIKWNKLIIKNVLHSEVQILQNISFLQAMNFLNDKFGSISSELSE